MDFANEFNPAILINTRLRPGALGDTANELFQRLFRAAQTVETVFAFALRLSPG